MKNKIQILGRIVFLSILTACIVFLPPWIHMRQSNNLLKKQTFGNIDMQGNIKITDADVASKLYNLELFFQPYPSPMPESGKAQNTEQLKETFQNLLLPIFEKEELVYQYVEEPMTLGTLYYEQTDAFTLIKDHPVALSFISIEIYMDRAELNFSYEEKTNTLISFSYYAYDEQVNPFDKSLEQLGDPVKRYYTDRLGLSPKQYNFYYETDTDYTHLYFGIAQSSPEESITEQETFQ